MPTAPRKMTAHTLEAPKGWPSPHAVDFQAKISSAVTVDVVFAGRVVHLNSSGEFEMGVSGTQMALFTFQNSDDPDVQNYGGDPSTEADMPWVPIAPTGKVNALVAAGAYELASTEFKTADESVLVPNTLLTANTSNTTDDGGRLERGVISTQAICGVVSRGVKTNSHGKKEVYFWPVYIPQGV